MMKKLGLLFKEISGNRIKENLKESQSVLIVNYSGLSSPDLSSLRQSLKTTKATFFVVRNNVARRILNDLKYDELLKFVEGPCGFIFIREEPVNASRVLFNFSKEHEQFKIGAGFLKDTLLTKKDIEFLAKLPSKETLRAQAVMSLAAPVTGFLGVLSQILNKFVFCLEQIKQKKENK